MNHHTKEKGIRKRAILILSFMGSTLFSSAQNVAINNSGIKADASAMLDISSDNKGILIPRLTSLQRTGMKAPANGLLVFDSDTNSFWFFAMVWKEIINVGNPGIVQSAANVAPTGAAGGDLSGTYPNPNVVKIQNLDVAAGAPLDKQIMKWDKAKNKWQGQNDSLFLPYNVSFASAAKLFGITNTNTTAGSSAIYGKSSTAGSGVPFSSTAGVWGDNSTGVGVVGTSNVGQGVYGFSTKSYGVAGYSALAGAAGIYGSHANDKGIGVMGEMQNNGTAVYGKATGLTGKAGLFESTNQLHTDTTLKLITPGVGILSSFNITNANSTKPAIDINHAGNGVGLKVRLNRINAAANAIDVVSQGSGIGVYSNSENGIAGKFETSNTQNSYPTLMLANKGAGSALYISSAYEGIAGSVIDVINNTHAGVGLKMVSSGAGANAIMQSSNEINGHAVLKLQQDGMGKGLEAVLTHTFQHNSAAVYGKNAGGTGVEGHGTDIGVLGEVSADDGIGVLGTCAPGSGGIGVKAISYNSSPNSGSLTAINQTDGYAIYAESTWKGTAVFGKTSKALGAAIVGKNEADQGYGVLGYSTGIDGVGILGESGQTNSLSKAAIFRNVNSKNDKTVVEIINSGTGNDLYVFNSNAANASTMFRLRNGGPGKYISFEDGNSAEKFSVAKSGNIKSEGTVTVKGDKGIVRNSTSTQLRTEILQANLTIPVNGLIEIPNEGSFIINVNFATPFSAPPVVSIGNIVKNVAYANYLVVTITDVTNTGCKFNIVNPLSHNVKVQNTAWKLVATGAE